MSGSNGKHRGGARVPGALLLVALSVTLATASGAVPSLVNYQGYLTDNGSAPVTGLLPMTFTLYPDSTTGAPLWTESYAAVQVTAGVFNVTLGQVSPLSPSVLTGAKLWLLTNVNGADVLPRRPIVTVGYAFRAAVADSATKGGTDLWSASGADVYRPAGKVGIGTPSPTAQLDIASAAGQAVERLRSSSGALISMQRYNSGSSFFVETGANAVDNFSIHRGAPYNDFVIRGDGNVGLGTTNPGYPLEVTTTIPTTLTYFHSEATSGNNYAVDGQALGVGAAMNVGGYFAALGATGANPDDNNHAIMVPPNRGNVLIGTAGTHAEKLFVAGFTKIIPREGTVAVGPLLSVLGGDGIYATGSTWAGYFAGDVRVTGTLYNPLTVSRIDHPLDPANKYLSLAAVESPEMKTVYDGVVTTDANGFATVELPDYSEALNRDFRYQLTVVGQFAQAIVSSKIRGNRFTIRTDKPGVEVSWQVTGIRQDAYARANPNIAERDKDATDRAR